MTHLIRVLLEIAAFVLTIFVIRPQWASRFLKAPTRRKLLIPLFACVAMIALIRVAAEPSGSSAEGESVDSSSETTVANDASNTSSQREQFLQTWSEAKSVLDNAKSNGQGPACSAEVNQLYNTMMKSASDIQHAIETAKGSNLSDPQNNSLVNDFYQTGSNVLPPLINLTRSSCGV